VDLYVEVIDVAVGELRIYRSAERSIERAFACVDRSAVDDIGQWLKRPRIMLHFTPPSGSWLNLVAVFLGIITRQAIRRGTFTSVKRTRRRHQPLHRRLEPAMPRSPGPRPLRRSCGTLAVDELQRRDTSRMPVHRTSQIRCSAATGRRPSNSSAHKTQLSYLVGCPDSAVTLVVGVRCAPPARTGIVG
jgi:hypothetical protein